MPDCTHGHGPLRADGTCPTCLLNGGLRGSDAGDDATVTLPPEAAGHRGRGPVVPDLETLRKLLPQFEIQDLLGSGGMGAVFRARQPALNRTVALKVVQAKDGAAARFEVEAKVLARLNHPHIVTVYDVGRAGDWCWLSMEFVDGTTLRQVLGTGHLTPVQALAIVPQVCEALQYAHDQGIVHRDIKPENLLMDRAGRVKIADFGLARLLGDPTDARLTAAGMVMGTPSYMAPEQVEHPREVDHRADLFALGVVFYEMLTGELPLGRFSPPSRVVSIDVRLDEVVLRALEKEPKLRYQQASEIRVQCEGLNQPAPPVVTTPAPPIRRSDWVVTSRHHLLGWPLIQVAAGFDDQGNLHVARGWIAIGPRAVGGMAIGGRAFGVVACGGLSAGLISFGACSFGLLSIGGVSLGLLFTLGALSIGSLAAGGVVLAWCGIGGKVWAVHGISSSGVDPVTMQWLGWLLHSDGLMLNLVSVASFLAPYIVSWLAMRWALRRLKFPDKHR